MTYTDPVCKVNGNWCTGVFVPKPVVCDVWLILGAMFATRGSWPYY